MGPLLLQATDTADLPGGYGVALLQTLLALAAVCILAWVVLKWASQRGLGIGVSGARVKVIERVALDARRTLWLVKIGEKVLLLGAGDGAPPALLATMSESELPAVAAKQSFVEVLRGKAQKAPAVAGAGAEAEADAKADAKADADA